MKLIQINGPIGILMHNQPIYSRPMNVGTLVISRLYPRQERLNRSRETRQRRGQVTDRDCSALGQSPLERTLRLVVTRLLAAMKAIAAKHYEISLA